MPSSPSAFAILKLSCNVFFTSSLAMSFSIRAMSSPISPGNGDGAPYRPGRGRRAAWWNSRYFLPPVLSCIRTATATCAACVEPSPSTGNSLSTNLILESPFNRAVTIVQGALAVAAIVIEELDHGDVALRIAERDLARRREDVSGVFADALAMLSASATVWRFPSRPGLPAAVRDGSAGSRARCVRFGRALMRREGTAPARGGAIRAKAIARSGSCNRTNGEFHCHLSF